MTSEYDPALQGEQAVAPAAREAGGKDGKGSISDDWKKPSHPDTHGLPVGKAFYLLLSAKLCSLNGSMAGLRLVLTTALKLNMSSL